MLHSLGANGSAPEGSVGRYGLLYQWGRKDPFIGAKTVSGGEHAETYNAPGSEWKEEAVGVTTSLEFEEGIAYITEHPTTVSPDGTVQSLPLRRFGEKSRMTSRKQDSIPALRVGGSLQWKCGRQ